MSTVDNTIVPCPAFQDRLLNHFGSCHMISPPTKLLNFLLSAENSSGIRQIINPKNGKKRTAQLVYDQQIPQSQKQTVASCDLVCTATTERGNLSEEYDIDCIDGIYFEEKITLTDWIESCTDNCEMIMNKLINLMNATNKAANIKAATEAVDLINEWDDQVSTDYDVAANFLQLPLYTTGGNIDGTAFVKVDTAMELTEYCAPAVIFGDTNWYQYYKLIQSGCCSDAGLDIGDLFDRYGRAVIFDKDMNTALGPNKAIIMQNRSVQLLTFNYALNADCDPFTGLNWAAGSNYYSTVLRHPTSFLPIDVSFKSDCGVVHMITKATVKAVGLPIDLHASGESMDGVTWVNGLEKVDPA